MSEAAVAPRSDLSLLAMLRFVGRHIVIIGVCVVGFAVCAGLLASTLTPTYRAEVVVAPADSSSGLGGLGGQLGGLASLAGINIGAGGSKKSDEAIEYLRSRTFTAGFIQRHELMPVLFAKKWDADRKQWRDAADAPTIAEGVGKFSKKVRQVAEDRRTGIVRVSVIWKDRVAAAQWANWLVAEADQALRERAIGEQNRSIDYLKAESARTSTVEIATAISKLMESELKNAMLARTRDAYAFQVLDPAVAPDPKDRESPNTLLIVVMGASFGFVAGLIIAAARRRRGRP
ncbi:MAG: Wzz/FepE/Etk N-terminal domain-containing protein [Steroidobacteraceae bacterium]